MAFRFFGYIKSQIYEVKIRNRERLIKRMRNKFSVLHNSDVFILILDIALKNCNIFYYVFRLRGYTVLHEIVQ
jgi:hypothetical protein